MTYEEVLLAAGRYYRRQHHIECRDSHVHPERYDSVVFMEPLLSDAFGLELCMPQEDMHPELKDDEPRRLCVILGKDNVDMEWAGKWAVIVSKAVLCRKEYFIIERRRVLRVFNDRYTGSGFVPGEEAKPLIAIDAETGMLYQAQGDMEGFDRPFCFTDDFDRILMGDTGFRAMMTGIFELLSAYNPTWKDIIAHIEEFHQMGYPIEAQHVMSAGNKNDLFHRLLGSCMPLNYNRISLMDGILAHRMEPAIRENELPLFAQLIKEGWLETAKRALLRDRRPALVDTSLSEELLGRMLSLYYKHKVSKNTNTDPDYAFEATVCRDYVRLCIQHGQGVSFRYNSYRRLLREHDALMTVDNVKASKLENKNIIAAHSEFVLLRSILPAEFEWIKTDTRLLEEGKTQRNCVFVYKKQIEDDHCAIYHWEHEGRRYTIEFVKAPFGFRIAQMKRPCNVEAVFQDRRIVERLLEQHKSIKAVSI